MCHLRNSIYRCGHVHTTWMTCKLQVTTAAAPTQGSTGHCEMCQSWRSPAAVMDGWNVCFLRELSRKDDDTWRCCQCGFAANLNDAPSCKGRFLITQIGENAATGGPGASLARRHCDHAICGNCCGIDANGKQYVIGQQYLIPEAAETPEKAEGAGSTQSKTKKAEEPGEQGTPANKMRYRGAGFHPEKDMGFHLLDSDSDE